MLESNGVFLLTINFNFISKIPLLNNCCLGLDFELELD